MDNCSSSSSSTHWIALPSNVNTPTRQERNSVSSPRRVTATTFFSSSVNSSPCSFISAISTIEADRDYGAAVEERHELVCCNLPSSSSTFILENELQEQSLSLRRSELSSSRSRDLGYYSHTQLGYEQSQAQVVDQNLHRHNYRYQQPQPQPQPQQQQKQQQKLQWQQKSNDRKKGFGNNGAPQDHAHPQSHNRRCGSDHDLTQHRQQERLSFQVKDKAKYREEQVAPIVDTPLLPVQTSCLTCLPTPLTSGSPSNAPASVTNSASPIVPSPSSSCMCSVVASSIAAPSAVSLAHRRHRTVSSAVASLEFASALSKEHTLMGDSDRCEGEGSHTIAPSLVTLPPHSLFPSYHTAAQNNHDLDLNNKNTTTNNDWDNPVLQSSVSLPTPVPGTVLISSSFAQRLPQPPVQQRDFEAAGEPFTAPSLPSSEDTRLLASGIHSLRQQQLIHQLALQHQQYQQQHLQNSSCSNTTTSSSEFLPFTSNLLVSAHEFVDAATPSTRDMKAPRPSLLSGSLSNSAILTSSPEYMASPTGSSSSSHTPSSSSAFHSPSNSIIWTSSSRATVRRSSTAASRYIESPPESMALGQSKDKGTVRVRRFSRRRVTKACFDGLPRETKIHIFRYLSTFQLVRVSRVSRSWRGIAMDGSLWKAIDTTRYYKSIKDDQLRTLGTAASGFLRYANFRGCVQLTAASLSAIAEHCPNIERLNLTGCRSITSNAISDACMNMPLLVHLDLSGLQAVNNFTLQTMAVYCRSLQVLNLAWCKQISGSGLTKLTRSCQGLRKLNVSGCSSLEDRWMPMMGMNLPKLRELCLNGCSSLTDRGLIGLLSGLSVGSSKKHRKWRMKKRMASSVRVSSLGHLLINQSSCNDDDDGDDDDDDDDVDEDEDDVEKEEESERESEVDGEEDDDEVGAEHGNDASSGGQPQTLSFSATQSQRPEMNPEGLQTKLVYLGLSQCRLLTHESLRAISHLCSRHLRRLELSNCENLGDEGLIYLAQHCTHLRLLDLEEITSLTDVSLRAFAMHLPKLERICLSYCENVTDQGIIRMLRPAPNTTTLSTATAMMMNSDATTQYCRKLMHLELDNCLLITDRLLLEFANVLEERYAKAAERMKERERRREERRERLRQKKRKMIPRQQKGLSQRQSSWPTSEKESTPRSSSDQSAGEKIQATAAPNSTTTDTEATYISSSPLSIPARFRHIPALANASLPSYASSPLQPRSVLASTLLSEEVVVKKTRPGMRIMVPTRSTSTSSTSSSSSLSLWSSEIPSRRTNVNGTKKGPTKKPIRPTIQVFDCRNITLEGVEAAQARSSTLAIRSYYSWTHPSTSGPTTDAAFGGSGGMEGLDAEADEDEDGEESANGTGGMNSSQTSLHHLQLQQQHLQRQQQLLRRHRAANLLHRARVGLLGIPGDAAFTGGARSDGQCVIL